MYMDLYGLREQPFGVTPNPRFLYFSSMHKAALTSLVNSVCERRGFSVLIANPGMGKTSVIMQLLYLLKDSARTAFLFQSHGNTKEFLTALLQDIEAPAASDDLADMQRALNAAVLREAQADRQLVIVVDEAQNLSDETLEAIRLLSNFENPEAKLLHIIFAGQPALSTKLASPQLSQLRQRISVVAHLAPLTREGVAEYIERRLAIAGRTGAPLFTPDALDFIAQVSEGIPRNINNLCFHALSLGYAGRMPSVDLSVVQRAARALELKSAGAAHSHTPAAFPEQTYYRPPVLQSSVFVPQMPSLPPLQTSLIGADAAKKPGSRLKAGMGAVAGITLFAFLVHGGLLPAEILSYYSRMISPSAPPTTAAPEHSSSLNAPAAPPVAPSSTPSATTPAAPSSGDPPNIITAVDTDTAQATPNATQQNLSQTQTQMPQQPITAPDDTRIVRTKRKEDVEQLTRRYFGAHTGDVLPVVLKLNPGLATPPEALPAGTLVMIPSIPEITSNPARLASMPDKSPNTARASASKHKSLRIPVNVKVEHTQTIFEFAMEHYGKADRATVQTIRAANPQIRDIYQTLRQGQSMTLPAELEPAH
jgi:general secretion pathway protein A